ncbi:exodeoxyribonuclease VII small subunit [Acinetobacter dispersus]|jgi:exodeoxyribonuclease VII small subunit|uniref:exodeoxyribonuclease VII small subunit n=1 Tax=Acinetobacter dispersus TaxID=70348 RepID=UPI00132EBA01|nr:exodeoxyribonuclease VII small subunit [Acinetobacter dispersus]QHH96402.1 exodeoxyribonuclease VII [Acinetobacter dispersus]
MTKKELNFKEGYALLKKNAALLETQEEPDIDNLMKIVEESMTAYKACKSRVDAVQQALNETFKDSES